MADQELDDVGVVVECQDVKGGEASVILDCVWLEVEGLDGAVDLLQVSSVHCGEEGGLLLLTHNYGG